MACASLKCALPQRALLVFGARRCCPGAQDLAQAAGRSRDGCIRREIRRAARGAGGSGALGGPEIAEMVDGGRAGADVSFFAGAMPKEEIGALRLLKDHPEFDGRGVVVAIFDTGIDPGAAGLQVTSDGKPKVIDIVDATGDGDVDTSKVVSIDADGYIIGRTGKKLKPNPTWENPSGEWRVGVKRLYEVLPGALVKRLKQHRSKALNESQRQAVAAASAALAEFERENPKAEEDEKKKQKAELETRVKLLQQLMDKVDDPGPAVDCVVWNDGDCWRVALDTTELEDCEGKGALADFEPLTNFRTERKYGTFSAVDACNFACNIYDDGNVLSIAVDCHSHGTHVAGIVSAFHPEDPSMNGIAPGAQIVGCKIGDNRLNSAGILETGAGLTRAAITAIENKVDIINHSYGEVTAFPNEGRIIDTISDLVYKHGVIFCSAAGNNGPGLTSMGAPGTCEAVFSIGAYVSPSLAAAGHSLREVLPDGQQYTFTSRGPCADGATGPSFAAPGGAVAPVPQWSEERRKLMNGTSMAAPNASGGVALLLSGLKAQNAFTSPNRLRRAIANTCAPKGEGIPGSALTYGSGLMQVDKAWEYLQMSEDVDKLDVRYVARVQAYGGGPVQRGIYLRDCHEVNGIQTYLCTVTPKLHEDADVKTEKLNIEDKLSLESTVPWVTCPEGLLLTHNGRSFEVSVNPTGLPEGLHYAEVAAYDMLARWRGPLFRVPITVAMPVQGEPTSTNGTKSSSKFTYSLGPFDFAPGHEVRQFIAVPEGATWAEISLSAGQHEGSIMYFVDIATRLPAVRTDDLTHSNVLRLQAGGLKVLKIPVVAGSTMEVVTAQYWSSLGKGSLSMEVDFHGVQVLQGRQLHIDGSAGNTRIQVVAPFRRETIKPSGKLDTLCIPLVPTDPKLEPFMGPRDALPENRVIHKLQLTYKLSLTESGNRKVTFTFPMLNRQVYDSEIETQLLMVYDSNKKLILAMDEYSRDATLKKGDYTLRLQIRHEKPDLLEKLKDLPLLAELALEKAAAVPVYVDMRESLKRGTQVPMNELRVGAKMTMVVGPLSEDLPKECTPGSLLKGSLSLGQVLHGDGAAPSSVQLTYTVPPAKAPAGNSSSKAKEEEKELDQKLKEAVRDAKIKVLEDIKLESPEKESAYSDLLTELKTEFPSHLPLLLAALKKLDGLDKEKRHSKLPEILTAADAVVAAIDTTALACFLAQKCPEEGEGAEKKKKEMSEQKSALVEAMEKKLTALLDMEEAPSNMEEWRPDDGEAEKVFRELRKWVDTSEVAYAQLHARYEARAGRYGEAIKALDKIIASDDKPTPRDVFEMKIDCLKALGWAHWEARERATLHVNYPPDYALF